MVDINNKENYKQLYEEAVRNYEEAFDTLATVLVEKEEMLISISNRDIALTELKDELNTLKIHYTDVSNLLDITEKERSELENINNSLQKNISSLLQAVKNLEEIINHRDVKYESIKQIIHSFSIGTRLFNFKNTLEELWKKL